jgi:two-component system phosphate regulon sensor histidine kinase PhoR
VSHQLKAPRAAVKQSLDVLLYTGSAQLPPETVEWISRSQARIAEMLSLIQDWLMLAKLDRGALCDRNASADIGKIAESVIREYRQLPSAATVTLTAEAAPGLAQARGDTVSLSMLVGNLVSNAVKYNRPGGEVKVSASSDDEWITLKVRDTGIGIPEDVRAHLFEEFYRGKTPETQNIPGTGLGLVICKKIVDELGGSIEVESKGGEYTIFTVRLPIADLPKDIEYEEAVGK